MTRVGFPNFGISDFHLNPVAIEVFGLEIRWYALIIVSGIMLAFAYACHRANHEGVSFDTMLDYFIYTVLFGIIGARFYYVITSLDQYDSFLEMLQIWNGGLAIYGGVIFGALAIFVVSKIKKIKVLRMFDAIAPGVMIGQLVGRWGNFFNGEAFGGIAQYEFLGNVLRTPNAKNFPLIMQVNSYATGYQTVLAHPTFFYESVWNLIGFLLINAIYRKKKFHGQIFFMYIGWYGFGRMIIEGFRSDSLYVGGIRVSQLVGLLCFMVSAVVVISALILRRGEKPVLEIADTDEADKNGKGEENSNEKSTEAQKTTEKSEENLKNTADDKPASDKNN